MTKIFALILASIVGVSFAAFCSQVAAENGLPPSAAAFGGSFGGVDPGTYSACGDSNVLTSNCSCPGGRAPAIALRTIKDAAGGVTRWGGWTFFCPSSAASEFAGAYQVDDPVPGGQGCRYSNPATGTCSCPSGSVALGMRTLTDSAVGVIGSHSVLCSRVTTSPQSFAGAYQVDDPAPGGWGCRVANPYTGSCSCPAGFTAQPLRVQVDTGGGFIGSHVVTCVPPLPQVQLCPTVNPGILADPSGSQSSSQALAQCVASTPIGGILEIPAGTYRATSQLTVDRPITIRTQGTAGLPASCGSGTIPCVTIQLAPDFSIPEGAVAIRNTSGVTVDHLIIDGNRSLRVNSFAWNMCSSSSNRYGFNAVVANCINCSFNNSASIAAVCGTGLEWNQASHAATIRNSYFVGNGQNAENTRSNVWADGLTVHTSNNAIIQNNVFIDNSDIGFIIGGGTNAVVSGNYIRQSSMYAFAGFMMDNFDSSFIGDFTGTVVEGNTIICDRCFYGANIGPHAWYLAGGNIRGGTFRGNYVSGGHIAVNVNGAGIPTNPLRLVDNNISPPSSQVPYACFRVRPARLNVSTDSYLTPDSSPADSNQNTDGCHSY